VNEHEDYARLREFREDLATPTQTRLAPGRARLLSRTTGETERVAPVRPRRWLAAFATIVAVIAVTAGAVWLFRPPGFRLPFAGSPNGDKTDSVPGVPSPTTHAMAVHLLEQAAATAEAEQERVGSSPPIAVGQRFLYVRESNLAPGQASTQPNDYIHEMWMEPTGCIVVMIRRTDGTSSFTDPDPNSPKSGVPDEANQDRARLAADGPSLTLPTAGYLAGLPTDPAKLMALLRKAFEPSRGAWSTEHAVFDQTREMMHRYEPLLTPPVRAAWLRALATVPSATATGELLTLGGHRVFAVGQLERGETTDLLLDADTGRIVGYRNGTFWAIWQHSVVDTVGATPS
jgi:hypothetical protein